jgi:hypothetical protein
VSDADRVPSPRGADRVHVPRGPARGRASAAAPAGPLVQLNVRLPAELDRELALEVNAGDGASRRTKQEIVTEALRAYFASRRPA